MPLIAHHAHAGALDATRDDLGAAINWATIYRVRPPRTAPRAGAYIPGYLRPAGLGGA